MGMMKIGNITPRAGFEPTPLALLASVLTITPPRLSGVITLSARLPVYVAPCLKGLCRLVHQSGSVATSANLLCLYCTGPLWVNDINNVYICHTRVEIEWRIGRINHVSIKN